jgi:general stress protein 26
MNDEHEQRIINELKSVGMTRHGLAKPESRELPMILHEDEHIRGVIYGRSESNDSAMLVATDRRVLFLDNQFLFKTIDELSYDVVSGISSSIAGPFTSITLHTRVTDYTLRYVNAKCARIFIKYIEAKRLEDKTDGQQDSPAERATIAVTTHSPIDETTEALLKGQNIAVLSTVDRTGNVHGAVIHYVVDQNYIMYILTKSGTGKGRNIYSHEQVAVTIHEPGTLKTLQMQGIARIETDQMVRDNVFLQLTQPRNYKDGINPPPVTQLHNGSFMVIRVIPTIISYHDYAKNKQ